MVRKDRPLPTKQRCCSQSDCNHSCRILPHSIYFWTEPSKILQPYLWMWCELILLRENEFLSVPPPALQLMSHPLDLMPTSSLIPRGRPCTSPSARNGHFFFVLEFIAGVSKCDNTLGPLQIRWTSNRPCIVFKKTARRRCLKLLSSECVYKRMMLGKDSQVTLW